jgi:hypothetical protein
MRQTLPDARPVQTPFRSRTGRESPRQRLRLLKFRRLSGRGLRRLQARGQPGIPLAPGQAALAWTKTVPVAGLMLSRRVESAAGLALNSATVKGYNESLQVLQTPQWLLSGTGRSVHWLPEVVRGRGVCSVLAGAGISLRVQMDCRQAGRLQAPHEAREAFPEALPNSWRVTPGALGPCLTLTSNIRRG